MIDRVFVVHGFEMRKRPHVTYVYKATVNGKYVMILESISPSNVSYGRTRSLLG